MKKLISLILAVFALFTVYSLTPRSGALAPAGGGVGLSIAGFSTTDLTGKEVTSAILENAELTVINYWATWCPPCLMEMPHLAQLYKSTAGGSSIQLIGVISEGNGCTPATAGQYLDENAYGWTNLRTSPELNQVFFTENAIPQTLVVDSSGKVLAHRVGAFSSYDQLYSFVSSFLGGSDDLQADPTEAPRAAACGLF